MPTIGITHLDILRIYAYMAVQWYKADTDLSFDEWLDALNEKITHQRRRQRVGKP